MTRGSSRLLQLLLVAASLALAGCTEDEGSGDGDQELNTSGTNLSVEGGAGANVSVDAPPAVDLSVRTTGAYPVDPGYELSTTSIAAGAEVNVTFTNEDPNPIAPHDWVLAGVSGAQTDTVMSGGSATVTFTAPTEPGEYTYFCSVGDHRDRGMEGTLTIT